MPHSLKIHFQSLLPSEKPLDRGDLYRQIDTSLQTTFESLHESELQERDENQLEFTLESFQLLYKSLTSETASPSNFEMGRALVAKFYQHHGLNTVPSMESNENVTVSVEGVIAGVSNTLKKMRSATSRFKLRFLKDRNSPKAVKAVNQLTPSLKSQLNKAKRDTVEIDLSAFGKMFVVGNKYVTDIPQALSTDGEALDCALAKYSKNFYDYFRAMEKALTQAMNSPENAEEIYKRFESATMPQEEFPKKLRGTEVMLGNVNIDLKWPNARNSLPWQNAFSPGKNKKETTTYQPSIILYKNDGPVKGTSKITLDSSDAKALIDYTEKFTKVAREAQSFWLKLEDIANRFIDAGGLAEKVVNQTDGPDGLAIYLLAVLWQDALSSMEKTQQHFFKHGLEVSKTASRLAEKVLGKES